MSLPRRGCTPKPRVAKRTLGTRTIPAAPTSPRVRRGRRPRALLSNPFGVQDPRPRHLTTPPSHHQCHCHRPLACLAPFVDTVTRHTRLVDPTFPLPR